MSYLSVRIEGNILTDDILQSIGKGEAQYQSDKDFGTKSVRDEILTAWADLKRQYETYKSRKAHVEEDDSGMQVTRTFWSIPLLQLLGYSPTLRRAAEVINDKTYLINYPDENRDGFPILLSGFRQELDRKPPSGLRISPHALMQDYLNVNDGHIYGIVTNGDELRLLRDSSLMTRLSHVSFDLVRMLEEDLFSDFQLMYRLLHASRMPQDKRSAAESILETYHEESLASGSRIRNKLSEAVEQCLLKLGTAFLNDAQNKVLRDWATTQADAPTEYYDWLLKLIYRMLFLLVIEERDLIYPEEYKKNDALREKRRIYYHYYSLQRLRKLADKRRYASERHADLWEQMLATFLIFDAGDHGKALGIKPLAGDLFSGSAIGKLNRCRLNNKILLECIRLLNHFENKKGQLIRVNYASLDVEEFGSVYEGLLEYAPVIDTARWSFSFKEGSGRSISGSHYTPDELVQPLIKHSLDHLITDRTVPLNSNEERKKESIQKILSLSVCDVACGSGHILLAAARRIGLEVARLRTGEQQPNLVSARMGTRDAIRHCIYGVDKNPLAVTLCKVALWLEAHSPGEPLNFLDHKIKCGDSIVGIARIKELENGIATESFKEFEGDDKDLCTLLRQSNKKDKEARAKGQLFTSSMLDSVGSKLEKYREKFKEFQVMPENTIEEIQAKRKAYASLNSGSNWWFVNNLANLQTAQFFLHKTHRDHVVTDSEYFDIMAGRKTQTRAEGLSMKEAVERRFFHWFLEFPQVFGNGGFNCILGNPPYLGKTSVSGAYGYRFLEFMNTAFTPIKSCDLVIYFLRRAYTILTQPGFLSIITTNSISEGTNRKVGLEYILETQGGTLTFAQKNIKWPGAANLTVSLLAISTVISEIKILNGKQVKSISSFLEEGEIEMEPFSLKGNKGISFEGYHYLGDGFVIEKEIANAIVSADQRNSEVVVPIMNGDDINNSYDSQPTKYIIFFQNWSIEKSQQFTLPFEIVKRDVLPYRSKVNRKSNREKWWQFAEARPGLTAKRRIFSDHYVASKTTKYLVFAKYTTDILFTKAVVVVFLEKSCYYLALQSSVHEAWARKYSSSLETRLTYTASACLDTFPFPPLCVKPELEESEDFALLENSFLELRNNLMYSFKLGFTKIYNQYHNAKLVEDCGKIGHDISEMNIKHSFNQESWNLYKHLRDGITNVSFQSAVDGILKLRLVHTEIDEVVLAAYGWHIDTERWGPAIQLRHDFYEVDYLPENDRVRYTIHPDARKEVLKRLLLLNHEIHEAEERGIPYEQLNEEKIIALLQKKVEKWLPHTDRLLPGSLKALCAGEDLLPSLHTATVQSYNAFVVQYGSAIEYEMLHKIFIPFNDQFQQQHTDEKVKKAYLDTQIAADPKNMVSKFARMLLKGDTKYTLGDMQFILNLVYKTDGTSYTACTLLQDLRTFVLSRYTDIILTKDFLHRLDTFIKTFRNEAAHTGMVSREDALKCRDEVRGVLGVMVEGEVIPD